MLREAPGPARHAENRRPYLFEITTELTGGQLCWSWTYGPRAHRLETVLRLAGVTIRTLQSLIGLARTEAGAALTPSDFPEAGLNQEELDQLVSQIKYGQGAVP
jgi:non-ribosomal peptide synthase protein (TIGR01720 family)